MFTAAQKKSIKCLQDIIDMCGGQQALADKLGVGQPRISMMLNWQSPPTPEICKKIEKMFGTNPAILRPDIFG